MLFAETELLTWDSLGTYTGLAFAVVAVTNSLNRVFNWNPPWVGLVVSLLLSVLVSQFDSLGWRALLLGLLNGFVVYSTAVGVATVGNAAEQSVGGIPTNPNEPQLASEAERKEARVFVKWFTHAE